jgi:hypothetical protein
MDIAAADELIRQLRAIEDLRPSTPTAHEGRQLTTAFLKVESQLARRVIIELVEKLAARPAARLAASSPRAGPAALKHRQRPH